MPLHGERYEGINDGYLFGEFFELFLLAWVATISNYLSGLIAFYARISQRDFRINADR
jgi:hypothetical protein